MLIYGGSSLEAGGFLEPEVFAFVRTLRFEATDDQSQHTKSLKVCSDCVASMALRCVWVLFLCLAALILLVLTASSSCSGSCTSAVYGQPGAH